MLSANFMWGMYAAVLGMLIIGGLVWATFVWWKKKHPYVVTIRKITTGKPIVLYNLLARKVWDTKYGDYLITWPRNIVLPLFRNEAYNPTVNGKLYLDVTVKDDYFYENQLTTKTLGLFTKKKYTKEQFNKLLEEKYSIIGYAELEYINNPMPYTIRDFWIKQMHILLDRTKNQQSFWMKFGAIVFSVILLLAFSISGFMIYQGAQQQASKMIENAPKCAEIQEQTKKDILTGVGDILKLGVPTG